MPDHPALRTFKADFFTALAHPLRIQILDALRDREHSVGELRDLLAVETPNVSQQLAVLRGKSLVRARKRGNSVFYSVSDPAIFELLDVAKRIFNNHLVDLQVALETLQES